MPLQSNLQSGDETYGFVLSTEMAGQNEQEQHFAGTDFGENYGSKVYFADRPGTVFSYSYSPLGLLKPGQIKVSSPNIGPGPNEVFVVEKTDSEGAQHVNDFIILGSNTGLTHSWIRAYQSAQAEFKKYSETVEFAFQRIPEESMEDEHAVPPEEVIGEARRIVSRMLRLWPREYDVYPMDHQRVAVEVDGGFGRRVMLLCEPGGSALCIVTVDRVSRRARYEDSSGLPDGFMLDALKDMGSRNTRELEALLNSTWGRDDPL